MDLNFKNFIDRLKELTSSDSIYQEIISLGKTSRFKTEWDFHDSDKVIGCQSLMYVRLKIESDTVYFEFYSDAIISQGLAALLVHFYSGMTLKQFIMTPPLFLKDLNLGHLLSPGRSNGVNSLYKKMLSLVLSSCKEM
jgi:cysteine desulfuration protein SufE